jgi:uncharacterized protein YbbK (DUF523 family)
MMSSVPVRIGVSSCLLGAEVRYDGGHRRSPFLVDGLGAHVEWVPVCPEIECGMGVPREPVRLVSMGSGSEEGPESSGRLRMVGIESGRDWTEEMKASVKTRLRALGRLDLSGYVLKSKSPSCGKEGVPVFPAREMSGEARAGGNHSGSGLFAAELMRYFPLLPVEDEARLGDRVARRHFLLRVFSYYRRLLSTRNFSAKALEELCCKQARALESLTNNSSL